MTAPTAPITPTFASALVSSISACVPNMRFRPDAGFILEGLGAIADQRKPSEPSMAGVPTAAISSSSARPPKGRASGAISLSARSLMSNCSMSLGLNISPERTTSDVAPSSSPPNSENMAAPPIMTSATPSSLDWRTSPFLALSFSRLSVGASVFSPPPGGEPLISAYPRYHAGLVQALAQRAHDAIGNHRCGHGEEDEAG